MLTITTQNSVYEIRSGKLVESVVCDDGTAFTHTVGGRHLVVKKTAINPRSMRYEVGRPFIVQRLFIDARGFAHFDSTMTSKVVKQEGELYGRKTSD